MPIEVSVSGRRRLTVSNAFRSSMAVGALFLSGSIFLYGQGTAPNADVVARYEQILERAPVEGPSFDKLLQIYAESEGLEKLDARWAPFSAEPGTKGAAFSLLRGLLADRQGKTDQARKLLLAASVGAPDDFHVWLALGDFESRQGKWAEAIAALQKGLTTKVTGDDRLSFYRKLGRAQERNLQRDQALATWQKMVEEFPKDSFALEEAGTAELDEEHFDEARKTFQKLVDLTEPNSMNRVKALMRLAEVDDRQGKTQAAVKAYEAILPQTAEGSWLNRELRAQIEQIYRREDDLAGLVGYYQKWTQENPQDVEAMLLLAGALNELGKKPEALKVLRSVTTLAPDRHEVRQRFAEGLVEAKQYDEAITVLTALTADDPTEPRYWQTMGEAIWLKTQPPTPESRKATLDAWAHIVPAESKDIAAILVVADLCKGVHLDDEALAGYKRALTISPDASDIREKAVKMLVELKRQEEAWALLDAMTEGPLATASNYLKLATIDQRMDRKDAAAEAIQKGLALEPKNFELLSLEWSRLAEAQKWDLCIALFDQLLAAAPNPYFVDQLEARQVQALTSAGKLEETDKQLRGKLGTEPGLTEGELRLLLRILIAQSDPETTKAFDEAHKRFSQSVSLIRLEIDYNRRIGNEDIAVAALQKLIETMPQQKSDWLGEIVRIRQEQGKADEALKVAQQIIDASPASAQGYLVYAEIALANGKTDDAVAKLQAAIKLSEKPNDVRQRLARYYLEAGQSAKARAMYDDAFAAAETPQDKMTVLRTMTTAYFQDGQIDELIARFKKQQASEEGGWRYGLYLSAIYEQMQDFGSARKELAKSLAVRPKDTSLIKSLIGLAEKENDGAELLRYREMLVEVDPSVTNQIALANEFAVQAKPEQAWQIVQRNLGEVAKDPMAWKDVLNQMTDPEYTAKIKAVLEEAIRSKGDSFDGLFALVQFQLQQNDLEGAKKTLWTIVATPLPPPPPPAAATASAVKKTSSTRSAIYFGGGGFNQSALSQRASQSYQAINEMQQLMATSANSGVYGGRGMRYINRNMNVSTTLTPTLIKDRAIVYLSMLAVQQKEAEPFLKQLQAKMNAEHWPLQEQLVTYALIQATDPLLDTIEAQAKAAHPDEEADEMAYAWCERFTMEGTPEETKKRAEAARALISARLEADPQFKKQMALMNVYREMNKNDQTSEGLAKRKALVTEFIKTLDHKDPQLLLQAIGLASSVGAFDQVKSLVDELLATDRNNWGVGLTQQIGYLPMSLLNASATTKVIMPKEITPIMMELMRLGYPAVQPKASLPNNPGMSMGGVFYGRGYYTQDTFPPANRYFPPDRIGQLEPMFQQLKARDMLPAMYAALDAEVKAQTDWKKIYPMMLSIYFHWWDGKKDDAIAATRKLLEEDPSDDFRLLLAAMLIQDKKYADAIPVLESVTARYGPEYVRTQKQLLKAARLAKNQEVGQKAGTRLLALRLQQQELMQIMEDLREVGLKEKADELANKLNGNSRTGGTRMGNQGNGQIQQQLRDALQKANEKLAVDLARQILNRDPMAPQTMGNENYLRNQALEALKYFCYLEAYANDIDRQVQATPDSIRLNWLAGETYQGMEGTVQKTIGLGPLPQWLKLQRKGNDFTASHSLDGKTWKPGGQTTLVLPPKVVVGLWVTTEQLGIPVSAVFNQLAWTGKVSPAEAPAPAAPAPSDVASTNAPPLVTPPSDPLLQPWQQTDFGAAKPAGSLAVDPNGGLLLTGSLDDSRGQGRGAHFAYQTLEGDGSLIAQVGDFTWPADTYVAGRQTERRSVLAGLMIRESSDAASAGVAVALCPTDGVTWLTRAKEASPEAEKAAVSNRIREIGPTPWVVESFPQYPPPAWLKLARKGDYFTGSYSVDTKTWSEIFSWRVNLAADLIAGVMVLPNPKQAESVAWSGVEVKEAVAPAKPAPEVKGQSSEGLPAPWQFASIGNPVASGAKWTDGVLRMDSPMMPANATRSYGYVYRPLHADGEIIAHLDTAAAAQDGRVAGLGFRTGLTGDSVEFYLDAQGRIGYYLKFDPATQAMASFKRVAQLSPKNIAALNTIAEQLVQARKYDAAADLYVTILGIDFMGIMNRYYNMVQTFDQAKRLPELVKIIEDWKPQPANPFGGGTDIYSVFVQMGNQMQQLNHLPEAEKVYRKALTLESYSGRQEAIAALAQTLIAQERRDEAAAEIEKFILTKEDAPTPATAPLLGFSYQNRSQGNANWYNSVSWSSNGMVVGPAVRFLEMADDLGVSDKIRKELKARPVKTITNPNMVDPDRITTLLLAIIQHDPAYRAELDQLLKDIPPTSIVNMSGPANVLLIIARELQKWPEERGASVKLVKQVFDRAGTSQGPHFQNLITIEMLNAALITGDHKLAQETLQKMADSMRQQRAINVNQVQLEQMMTVIKWMLQEGMVKEASDFLAELKSDPRVTQNGNYYVEKVTQLENEVAFAKGEASPLALAYGLTKGKGDSLLFSWQVNAGEKQQSSSPYASNTSWRLNMTPRPTANKIEISAGPDPKNLKLLTTLDKAPTTGSAPIKLPPGTRVLQASLIWGGKGPAPVPIAPKPNPNAPKPPAPAAPATTPSTTVVAPLAVGSLLLVPTLENLLPNPEFKVKKDASGKSRIADWRGLPTAAVSPEKGGPVPALGYLTVDGGNNNYGNTAEITSARIPLAPGTSYVFGGWMRFQGSIKFKFYDAEGKALDDREVSSGSWDQFQWRSWLLAPPSNRNRDLNNAESIPDKAVAVEIVMKPNQESDLADLSFRAMPAATETPTSK